MLRGNRRVVGQAISLRPIKGDGPMLGSYRLPTAPFGAIQCTCNLDLLALVHHHLDVRRVIRYRARYPSCKRM
jgi:hypothetical protein